MRPASKLLLLISGLVVALALGGCPQPPDGDPNDGNDPNNVDPGDTIQSALTVTKTAIPIRHDASLFVGEDLIVFGSGELNGVQYIQPSLNPTTPTAIPGDFRSDGFAVARKKVLVFNADGEVTVFNTVDASATPIDPNEVTLAPLPDQEGDEVFSPLVADGDLALVLNRAAEVTDGRILKVVNVAGATPVITPLVNPPTGVAQIWLDAGEQVAVAQGGNSFHVYNLTTPNAAPQTFDLAAQGGITGPFVYDAGVILYVATSTTENIRALPLATGVPVVMPTNRGNKGAELALNGGKYAYFLERDAFDTFNFMARVVIGDINALTVVEGGFPGVNPATRTHPWAGFGRDVAISPDGKWIFIAGSEGIDTTAEFLQVSTGGKPELFADGDGFLNATDVETTNALAAFKIGSGEATTLGYIVLP